MPQMSCPQAYLFFRKLAQYQFWMLLISFIFLGLSSQPGHYIPMTKDLTMHFLGYIAAAGSISVAYPKTSILKRFFSLWFFSIMIECAQYFSPARSFDLADIIANATGIATGLCIVVVAIRIFPSALNQWLFPRN